MKYTASESIKEKASYYCKISKCEQRIRLSDRALTLPKLYLGVLFPLYFAINHSIIHSIARPSNLVYLKYMRMPDKKLYEDDEYEM